MTKSTGRKKATSGNAAAAAATATAAPAAPTETVSPTDALFSLATRRQIYFWCATLLVMILFLYMFRSILLPFVAGMALAYLLDPVADRLEAMGASRLVATFLILILFVVLFVIALILIVPILSGQLSDLIQRIPDYVTRLQAVFANRESQWVQDLIGDSSVNIRENLNELLKQGAGWLSALLSSIWNSGKALLDIISQLVITPIDAFYLLLD